MSFCFFLLPALLLFIASSRVGAQVNTLVAFEANISTTVQNFTRKIHDTVNGCNATQLSYYTSPYSTRFFFNTTDTVCSSAVKAMSPEMRSTCSITSLSWHDGQFSLPPASQWQYALSGGGNAGVLLVRPSAVSPWGTVCDDSFSNREALVACRALGFSPIRATFTNTLRLQSPLTNVPIYMDDVQCSNASATRLSDCSFIYSTEFVARHDCNHYEDIYLDCAPVPLPTTWEFSITGSSPYAGLLSVRPSSAAAWGTVCGDSFDATAALAACKSIGYPSTSATVLTYYSPNHNTGTGPIYMDDVVCPAGSTNLMNCTYIYSTETVTNHNCVHSYDVTINCFTNGDQPFYQPPASAWQYKLDGGISGLLLVRPSAVSPWGTVCDDSFTNREALVACRALGYVNISKVAFYTKSTSLSSPIYMDNVQCANASATRLSDCSFNYSTEFVKRHDCTHAEDIYLDCAPVERPTTWEFSITGSSPYAGLLSVRPSSAAAWGTVCDDSFDATAALAACKSIGYLSTSAIFLSAGSPNHNTGTGPIYMDDVVCPVGSMNLMNCTYIYSTETVTNHNCAHSEDVTINCFPNGGQPFYQPPASAWQYKLDGGISGLLLVRPSAVSPWGTVCDDSFTNREALVACRALGFSNIAQAAFYSSSSFLSTPIYMDDVQCTDASATRLSDCSFTYSTEFVARHDCNHYEDIYLDCSGYSLPVAGRGFADPGAFPGLVVGCVLGSMVVVGLIVGVSIYCCCRRRYPSRQVEQQQVATDYLGSSNQPVVGVYAHNHEPLERKN